MAAADYRLMTEATGQRIAAALEALSGTGAAAAAARTNLDVYSKGETDTAIQQSTAYESSYNAGFLRGAVEHYGLTITNHAAFLVVVVDDSETNVYVGIFMFKYGTEIFKVDLANKGINYQTGNAQGTIAFTGITGTAKYTATRIG